MRAPWRSRRPRTRVLIVGAGEIAASGYLPALARLGWSATILDADSERARSLASRYRDASATSRSVSAADPSLFEAVVIATPLRTHHELAVAALDGGAPAVLVEKPAFGTAAELDTALTASAAAGARLLTTFYTRAWPSIREARRLFPRWREEFGTLNRVLVSRGGPWTWGSVASRERGAAGLEPLLLEELPHPLDSAFYVTGWRDVSVEIGREPATETPWKFAGSAFVTSKHDGRVHFEVQGSRADVLANAVVFEFETAGVSVELSPTGGVMVQRDGTCHLELSGVSALPDVRDMFAGLLAGAVGGDHGAAPPPVEAAEWAGPLAVVEALRETVAEGERAST